MSPAPLLVALVVWMLFWGLWWLVRTRPGRPPTRRENYEAWLAHRAMMDERRGYEAAVAALTAEDREWLTRHGWNDGA